MLAPNRLLHVLIIKRATVPNALFIPYVASVIPILAAHPVIQGARSKAHKLRPDPSRLRFNEPWVGPRNLYFK